MMNSQLSPKAYPLFPHPPRPLNKKQKNPGTSSRHMLTEYLFYNNIHDKPTPFKGKFSWTPPSSENRTSINFFRRTEQEPISINTPRRKTYSNLALEEKATLNNLKNNQSVVTKPCDKIESICIMNTRNYLTKIHTYLQDHNTRRSLTFKPTSAIANDSYTLSRLHAFSTLN